MIWKSIPVMVWNLKSRIPENPESLSNMWFIHEVLMWLPWIGRIVIYKELKCTTTYIQHYAMVGKENNKHSNSERWRRGTFYRLWFTAVLKFQWEDIVREFPCPGGMKCCLVLLWLYNLGRTPLFIVFQVTSYTLWESSPFPRYILATS